MRPWSLQLAIAATSLLGSSAARATQTVIADFEDAGAPAPWVFSNGPEFPGAAGSLTSGGGAGGAAGPGATRGTGAALAYDFHGGGHYVAMTLTLPLPLSATALAYSANVVGAQAVLEVTDSTQQVLTYAVSRPLEASAPTSWYRQIVDLTQAPTAFSGGANDGTLHPPITAIALVAENVLVAPSMSDNSTPSGLTGVMGVDDVIAWDVLPATLDPDGAPLPPPASSTTSNLLGGLGVQYTDDASLEIAAAAGFSRVRFDLGWQSVETTRGVYDFSGVDARVSALEAQGLKAHVALDFFNTLYPLPTESGYTSSTVPAFAAVTRAAAAHLVGHDVTYEVWNEQDGDFWPPGSSSAPNAPQYAALCAPAIAAVHQGDPAALVSTGGMQGFNPSFLAATLAAGGGVGADAIGVHPYRMSGPESMTDELAYMRVQIAAAFSPPPPVWDTEWGYSSVWLSPDGNGHEAAAVALQAERVSREILSAWAVGFPFENYYNLRDDSDGAMDSEGNFGLIANDGSDKPAIVAVRTLAAAARGRTFEGFLPVGFTSLHAMLLVGATDRVIALWRDTPGSATEVLVPPGGSATDMLGAHVAFELDGGAPSIRVRETDGPVFLTYANPPPSSDGGHSADSGGGGGSGGGPAPSPVDASATSGAAGDASTQEVTSSSGASSRGGCQSGFGSVDATFLLVLAAALRRARRANGP